MSGDERMDTTESGQWGSNSPRAAEEAENGWGESAPKQDDDQGWGVSADRNGSDRRDDDRSRDRYADDRDRRDDRRDRSRSPARSREAEEDNSAQNPGNNLFVTNLSKVTREDQLEDLFIKYGKIEKLSIMYDPHTRESRQFAFVTFQRVDDADAAVAALNDYELDGKRIIVEKVIPMSLAALEHDTQGS
ncbi:hypothetical protein BC832DRAFT_554064 [Gaertneriomyces semiglobifer]|nr:hypothetical protein BC832DRAFT_554064 [Gaertneriomyces semiglobifer]